MLKTFIAGIIIVFLIPIALASCKEKKSGHVDAPFFKPAKTSEGQIHSGEYYINIALLKNEDESGNKIQATFLDKTVTFVREELIKRSETNLTWRGKVEGESNSDATFTFVDGFLQGQININADTYTVSPSKNGAYLVMKSDKSKMIKNHDDAVVPPNP